MTEPVRHTPGPWHPGHLGSDGKCQCRSVCDEGYAGGICTVHVGNGLPVAHGGNDAPPRDEAIANMHLIAAAPDLLAAVQAHEAALDYLESWEPDMDAERFREVVDEMFARAEHLAKDALAKATPIYGSRP